MRVVLRWLIPGFIHRGLQETYEARCCLTGLVLAHKQLKQQQSSRALRHSEQLTPSGPDRTPEFLAPEVAVCPSQAQYLSRLPDPALSSCSPACSQPSASPTAALGSLLSWVQAEAHHHRRHHHPAAQGSQATARCVLRQKDFTCLSSNLKRLH